MISSLDAPGKQGRSGWLFALPWIAGVAGLYLAPMALSLALSCVEWDGLGGWRGARWVGLENYRRIVHVDRDATPDPRHPWYIRALGGRPDDPLFYRALYNSLYYSLFAVPLGLAASLAMAALLTAPARWIGVFRTLYYLPHLLSGVATYLIWQWLFNPDHGVINVCLRLAYRALDPIVGLFDSQGARGWTIPDWLYDPAYCKPAVIIMSVWSAGGSMLIFLAALKAVPNQLHEAAAIDGAGRWARFRHVTLPQISPVILFNLVIGIAVSMQAFSQAYLLRHYSQDDGLLFYVLYIYQCAFETPYQLGYASALAWILFVIVLLLTGLTMRSRRWWVYHETA